ncbi:HNH endonuclease [Pararcticibacter amylolyticus]|uniref:HNH nuclease domain-containing protein n=1 Tax=Pararcticibacter amylolyticus TaxID=2173175 RepID=A0A2U2P9I8_9SPHI|nr:hypothetical protein [Pararcticibacter amylolyticus]PWG78052.1 hypothetical protein DDR33_24240 [Pararcticibacter amylolyticus]
MVPIRVFNVHRKAEQHADLIYKYLQGYKRGRTLIAIDNWLTSVFGPKVDIRTVLTADPIKMDFLVRKYKSAGIALARELQDLKSIYKRFRSPRSTPFLSASGAKYDGFAFCALIDVSVCPYCNRNYIISLEESGIATCELDHFYNKDDYPFFALSFYNLIPACKPCNHIKSNKKGNYHNPHSKEYSESDLLKFSVRITGASFLDSLDDLKLGYDVHSVFNDTFTDLKLQEVYEFHKIYVQDLIKKKYLYNEEYLEQLVAQYGGKLFSTREELMGLLLPGYISEDKLALRPFSKLSKDIWEQLSMLY